MSTLNLTLEGLDDAAAYASSKPKKASKLSIPWINSLGQPHKTPAASRLAGTTDYTAAKVAAILQEFLQPDSKTSLEKAAESLLFLISANASEYAEVYSFGEICVEFAEQIPYHHPSQLKLARLLKYLSRSPKFDSKPNLPPKERLHHCYQLLGESIRDNFNGSDTEHPEYWVNFHAFVANFYETGVFGAQPGYALWMMRDSFEEKMPKEACEQDLNVMAAAQWIIWYGQSLFKLILYGDDQDEDENAKESWRFGKQYTGPLIQRRSVERWRYWKQCFQLIVSDTDSSDECKKLASRSANLMDAIEKSMIF
ncbi:hypothetical protein B7463_g8636, partial [Scytalidium lignicola]